MPKICAGPECPSCGANMDPFEAEQGLCWECVELGIIEEDLYDD